MLKLSLRNLMARSRRLFTTGIAIILGVAFLVGTLVFTDTLGKLFTDLFATSYKGTDAWVRGDADFVDDFETQRPDLPEAALEKVRSTPGVAAASGMIQSFAQVIDEKGKAVGAAGGAPSFGFNWVTDDELNAYDIAEGSAPGNDREIVVDRDLFQKAKLRLGQEVKVLTQAPTETFTISGVATFAGRDSAAGTSAIFFTDATAQRLFDLTGKFDAISIRSKDGVSQPETVKRVQAALRGTRPATEVITGAKLTKESEETLTKGFVGPFRTFLVAFAVIALFVGVYVIANTFSIVVAQRTRELALLRAIGADRRQVSTAVVLEAVALGIFASLMGVVVGLLLALLLKFAFGKFGISLPDQGLTIRPLTVLIGLGVGLIATVLSAVWPAIRAGRTPPLAAMRDVAIDRSATSRSRAIAGVAVLAASALMMVWGFRLHGNAPLVWVGLSLIVAFVGVTVVGPVLVAPLTRVLGAPLPRMKGVRGSMAVQNAVRSPRRTSATAMALAIGVGVVSTILVLANSMKASFVRLFDEQITADFTVSPSSQFQLGFSPAVEGLVAAVPGVGSYSGLRFGTMRIDGDTKTIVAVRAESISELTDVGRVEGDLRTLGTDGLAVAEEVATKNGWRLGDTLPVEFSKTGATPLKVVALYERAEFAGNYVISDETYKANFTDSFLWQVLVKTRPGAKGDAVQKAIEKAIEQYPSAKVQDRRGYVNSQVAQFNQILGIVYALLGLSVFIALIGIRNTLSLSIFERTRELGLVRAVGMSRSQVRSTVRWEAVIVALIGTVLGIAVGVVFGTALVQAAKRAGEFRLAMPVGGLAIVAVIGALAGAYSARKPAKRAAKLDILAAIGAE